MRSPDAGILFADREYRRRLRGAALTKALPDPAAKRT